MPITDEDAALLAVSTLEDLSPEQLHAQQAIIAILHNDEPFVDVHQLFAHYNILYFRKLLVPRVEVLWSPRLTLCAGICELSKDPSTGKLTRIRLKLSTPLLQYRPRSDTINTLLHEAIHAYFFITTGWRHARGDDGTGHGAGFQLLSDTINNHGNYQVTVYHTFHDEVESYRTHIWQCDGPCKSQPPYFGLVKRSMNRPPGKSDTWWARHQDECGGTYTKIQEPAPSKKQIEAMSAKERAGRQKNKLDSWIKPIVKKTAETNDTKPNAVHLRTHDEKSLERNRKRKAQTVEGPSKEPKLSHSSHRSDEDILKAMVECPICEESVEESSINDHLDAVHPP